MLAVQCAQSQPASSPREVVVEQPAAHDDGTAPDAPAIVQARLTIGLRDEEHASFIDLEVRGPHALAMAACETMVRAEQAIRLPAEANLVVRIQRPCSSEAMAEPESSAPWALVQVEHLDSLDLALRVPEIAREDGARLEVRRRMLNVYGDEATCQAMATRLKQAEVGAEARAREAESAWLRQNLQQQEKTATQECKTPGSRRCKEARQIAELLQSRLDHGSPPTAQRDNRSTLCRRR